MSRMLFVGGIHGVGKTTFVDYIDEKYDVFVIEESVDLDSIFFERREEVNGLAQIMWFGKFIEMVELAMDAEGTFVVDRTPFDFVPYTDGTDLHRVFYTESENLMNLLKSEGHTAVNIFLTAYANDIVKRIKDRDRDSAEEEVESLVPLMNSFKFMSDMYNIPMIPHYNNEETADYINKYYFPFEV